MRLALTWGPHRTTSVSSGSKASGLEGHPSPGRAFRLRRALRTALNILNQIITLGDYSRGDIFRD